MKTFKKILAVLATVLCAAVIAATAPRVEASSSTTYTYAFDENHHFTRTQDAYLPGQTLTGLGLKAPADLVFDDLGRLVIADSGNHRIVVYDQRTGDIVRTITCPGMASPSGVFVFLDDSEYVSRGDIFVADDGAGVVFHFDSAGTLLETFGKPDSILLEDLDFSPQKVAVDKAGIMYVVSKGTSDGILQLSNTGSFLGYFSANEVTLSFKEQIQKLLFSQSQLDDLGINMTPSVFSSVFIDVDGIVYSSSSGQSDDNVKRHNTQGTNTIVDMFFTTEKATDIWVDDGGVIYVSDQSGHIDVYTNDGALIYRFGSYATDDIAGFFNILSSLAVDDEGTIWTVDEKNNYLQSFVTTDYSETIYEAIRLYEETDYEAAIELWQEVLRLNQMSILAHDSIARNYFRLEQYELAAEHFEIAGNRELYSEAYWELRNIWMQQWLLPAIMGGIFIALVTVVVRFVDRRKHILAPVRAFAGRVNSIRPIENVTYARAVMRKPSDSFYYLRIGRKGSYVGASILLVLAFFAYLFYIAGKDFIFQSQSIEDLDLGSIILGFVILIGLFIVCSWLVTSIQDGEGTLGAIFKGFAYSLWPFIVACVLTTALSYVATLNEVFVLQLVFGIGLAWSGMLIFLSVSEIQNYTFGQTVKSVLVTIVFVIVILLVLSFVQMTIRQLFTFLYELIWEAIRNVLG
ncbi:MAG: YIP1 family protein [Candidatus Izemoplasmatales bacterium]